MYSPSISLALSIIRINEELSPPENMNLGWETKVFFGKVWEKVWDDGKSRQKECFL